jgi:vacuolar-type H+-ATPase subunit I/STV1
MKIINYLRPTTLFGKVGVSLYLGGAIIYTLIFIYFWNNPSENYYFEFIINQTFWLIAVIGMIMYIIHLVKKRGK